ncbi:hypothetical protein VNO80_02833 [Phaseolus coccineus]|uniref:Uncharacterized protein n=1 Tax=Phaseolus coccineus TaxID=3886 RepID=A0AAN9NXK9_PHACN
MKEIMALPNPVETGLRMYKERRLIKRVVEQSGVPYTNIYCNSFANLWLCLLVAGIDIGKFTMKVIDDVRTVNKNVHFRPSNNCYSINELASI